ncbi:MAG: GntR family transcriptional regulator [Spirochaetae bacterium HGW-Spirochaetae-9]|nr:MAG: GntR family transcriptional regulator [Spirochaetae bacterium HGW-Spirochaetae-9]
MRNQTNQAYQIIRERILSGAYRPTESLTELTLAQELAVSRNTIKKALLKLASERLVVIEENKRAVVRSFTIDEVLQYLRVREILEGLVIREAIPLMKQSDFEEMESILASMKEKLAAGELKEYSQGNWRFHQVVYRLCPNLPAVEIVLSIKNQLNRYNVKTIFIQGRGANSFAEHRAILDAIEKRDLDEAERLIRMHVSNMREVLKKYHELLF